MNKERVKRTQAKAACFAAFLLTFAFLLLPSPQAPAVAPAAPKPTPQMADVQDLVFLGESRPVLIRLHVRLDGKPVRDAWSDFMKTLFDYLDVDGDGVLSKAEAARVPSIEGIFSGGLPGGGGGRSARAMKQPTLADLDIDKDGKVTRAELATWYRKSGFRPFEVHVEAPEINPIVSLYSGQKPEPPVELVSSAIFDKLDTNRTGKLTKKELAAAPSVLLEMDENEDEMVSAVELVPDFKPATSMFGGMMGRGKPGSTAKALIALEMPGESSDELVRSMQERYGKKVRKPQDKKLSRKDLGLDEATFRQLDTNGDGVLDKTELAGFVKRAPDVEFVVRLGKKDSSQMLVDSSAKRDLSNKVSVRADGTVLDLGITRAEFRGSTEKENLEALTTLVRQQYQVAFSAADTDSNGYIDKKEADANQAFKTLFHMMDRDGDGKLYEK